MASKKGAIIGGVVVIGIIAAVVITRPGPLVLTGIVTTNDVIVSPQVSAQLSKLLVKEGDKVEANQLLATLSPDELRADQAFAAQSEQRARRSGRGERSRAALSAAADGRPDQAGRGESRGDDRAADGGRGESEHREAFADAQ